MNVDIAFSKFKELHIVDPGGNTREVAQSLLYVLRNVSSVPWKINMVSNYDIHCEDILYIFIWVACTDVFPVYYIIYQVEPTALLNRYYYRKILSNAYYIWDYSYSNIKYLSDKGISAVFFPISYTPYISNPEILSGNLMYDDSYKDIDVLFLGHDHCWPRRLKIKEELINIGIKYFQATNFKLDEMKNVIKRAKICLNVHAFNHSCLEVVRLNILLSNQSVVLSEFTYDYGFDPAVNKYSNAVHFCKYNNIVKTCINLLKDFEYRRELAHKSYSWYSNRPWANIAKNTQLII